MNTESWMTKIMKLQVHYWITIISIMNLQLHYWITIISIFRLIILQYPGAQGGSGGW